VSVSEYDQCDDSQLCRELCGVKDGIAFHDIYQGDPESRIVVESSHFALVVDISPLTLGHTLLVPKAHYISFGCIPTFRYEELDSFRAECVDLVTGAFGVPAILEHGSSTTMRSSPCISHAHWHLVPNGQDACRIFDADGLAGRPVGSWKALKRLGDNDLPYIYYSYAGNDLVYLESLSKRHQYLRVVMAEIFGIPEPEWDWALTLRLEPLRETVKALTRGRVV
jgi:diadenosine tetraphosphate (Ap4A) HIT family hydrolase